MCIPRVLVFSNNSFSLTNSNGRTLGNLFSGWPKEYLAQFCISSDGPNWDICDHYCCVSDSAVLHSLLTLAPVEPDDLRCFSPESTVAIKKNRIRRTAFKSILRHFMWSLGIWRGRAINRWFKEFNPQIVIIQSGDTAFMHNLALKTAIKYKAKLVFFNTEGIYFFDKNFLPHGAQDRLFFPIYKSIFRNAYEKSMRQAEYAFYLNGLIKQSNDEVFRVPGEVIYTSSSIEASRKCFNENPSFVYLGNFGYGRVTSLITLSHVLQSISTSFVLDVYGRANDSVQGLLEQENGIHFHGFVPYAKITEIIKESDILFHVESFSNRYIEDVRYGFSTKIADCLASGKSFVLFSPSSIACAVYLKETGAGWIASSESELRRVIETIINDPSSRETRINRSLEIAKQNHSVSKSSKVFQNRLCLLASSPL